MFPSDLYRRLLISLALLSDLQSKTSCLNAVDGLVFRDWDSNEIPLACAGRNVRKVCSVLHLNGPDGNGFCAKSHSLFEQLIHHGISIADSYNKMLQGITEVASKHARITTVSCRLQSLYNSPRFIGLSCHVHGRKWDSVTRKYIVYPDLCKDFNTALSLEQL